jgi:hypothetical protein
MARNFPPPQRNRRDVLLIFLPFLFAIGFSALSWCQASINESLETATIYVDAKQGSDSNNGSQAAPLKTIGAAASQAITNNHSGIGTRVIINEGTYRESITINGSSRQTDAPITFQAATNGNVFVSGADKLTGWTTYSGNSHIYASSWPYNFGLCPALDSKAPFEQQILRNAEMIIVNSAPLTQVLALSAMLPGTFFVDQQHGTVYIYPAAWVDMSIATVEAAVRPHVLVDSGQSHLVFRGLTFQYANTCHGDAAVLLGNANNLLFDADNIVWNNAMGISFSAAQNFTVQNTTASHNGELGFHSHQTKYDLWQSDTASFNNWRGAQGAFYTWDTGGGKWMLDHSGTYNNITSTFNQGNGVAWDTDQQNVTLTNLAAVSNLGNGYQIEKSEGPFTISNSNLCYNNLLAVGYKAGVVLRNSERMTISGTKLFGNGGNQLSIVGERGGISVTNWETGAGYMTVTQNLTSTGNTFLGNQANMFSDYLGGTDWSTFVNTLSSNNNVYYDAANTTTGSFSVPSPRAGTLLDFPQWRSTTGQDGSSTWTSANTPSACAVNSGSPDFWLVTDATGGVAVDATGHANFNINSIALGGLTGTVALSSQGVSSVPGLTASFSPATVSAGRSAVFSVAASPSTPAGTYDVTILGNLGNITRTIALRVVVPAASAVRLSTASLIFGGQKVRTSSAPQTVTLTNYGTTALSIGSIAAGRPFAQTNNCGSSVNAGGSCTISVTFTPGTVGQVTGKLVISESISQLVVGLTGTGVGAAKINISPLSVYFGPHAVGTKSTEVVTLKNAGTAVLSFSNMAISGPNAADFKYTTTCGSSLAVGASCTVTTTFTPGAKGTRTATLSIYDNDGYQASPQLIPLQGTGQ